MEQLFNAPRCSHLIPWKVPDTLVIRICWGKPNRSTEDMPVMCFWKGLTFELFFAGKLPTVSQEESKQNRHTSRESLQTALWKDGSVPLLAGGSSIYVCALNVFSQCCFSSLMGIFMVKPITKGNLSQNTTPQETVKIKHGGLDELLSVFR